MSENIVSVKGYWGIELIGKNLEFHRVNWAKWWSPPPNLITYFQELGFPTDNLSDQVTLSHDLGLELADFDQLIQYLENSSRVCVPVQDQIYLITLGDVQQLLQNR
jgi:hypothetical protein